MVSCDGISYHPRRVETKSQGLVIMLMEPQRVGSGESKGQFNAISLTFLCHSLIYTGHTADTTFLGPHSLRGCSKSMRIWLWKATTPDLR